MNQSAENLGNFEKDTNFPKMGNMVTTVEDDDVAQNVSPTWAEKCLDPLFVVSNQFTDCSVVYRNLTTHVLAKYNFGYVINYNLLGNLKKLIRFKK